MKTIPNLKFISWIADCLSEGSQFVLCGDCNSSVVLISSVVAQGPVLGTLLSLIFTNNVIKHIPVKIRLYTDVFVLYNEAQLVSIIR